MQAMVGHDFEDPMWSQLAARSCEGCCDPMVCVLMGETDYARLAAIPFDQFLTTLEEASPLDVDSSMTLLQSAAAEWDEWVASVQRQ